MCASDKGITDVVQLLLTSGAQVDLQSKVRHNINLTAMSLRTPDTTSFYQSMCGVGRDLLHSRLFCRWKFHEKLKESPQDYFSQC